MTGRPSEEQFFDFFVYPFGRSELGTSRIVGHRNGSPLPVFTERSSIMIIELGPYCCDIHAPVIVTRSTF